MKLRSKVALLLAEFLGTAILATVVINIARSQIGISYFVSLGVGLTMAMLILVFGEFSGVHANPAVTVGLWTVRKISTVKAVAFLAVQMLGGLAAWQLANYFAGSEIVSIAPEEFKWTALIAEAVGAFVFTFAVASAIYQKYSIGKKAALVGGGLAMGIIVASLASNAVINPAIAIANQSWSKAYVFGPLIGGVIGINLYVLFFAPIASLIPAPVKATIKKSEEKPAVAKAKTTTKATSSKKATTKKKPSSAKKSTAKK